jgi:hypothetical protein
VGCDTQSGVATPKVLQVRERTPILFPFVVFTFGTLVESIKELGGASSCDGGEFSHSYIIVYEYFGL